MSLPLTNFVVPISEIFQRERAILGPDGLESESKEAQETKDASCFERSTTKYWVPLENVMKLKFLVAAQLPLLLVRFHCICS
jgi:SPX domain protein involved in polyphosphate accumulation